MVIRGDIMRCVVDRIEENIATLENRDTGEVFNIDLSEVPFIINEGDVIIYENNIWKQDEVTEKIINDRIKKKMDDLWE